MKLSLAFSPCPNDTFIFYGLAKRKIKTHFEYQVYYADVEELNQKALISYYDVSKLSFYTIGKVIHDYIILNAGAALGKQCGPLLITKNLKGLENLASAKVGIPGFNTTANFLLNYAVPQITHKIEYLFSDIENAVLEEKVDAGLIIHENRFTFHEKGLNELIDLGQYWEDSTNQPIPLGAIAMKREYPLPVMQKVQEDISNSLKYAYVNKRETLEYCREYAQEMEFEVMQQHIDLYVNEFTAELGNEGKLAAEFFINEMFKQADENLPGIKLFV